MGDPVERIGVMKLCYCGIRLSVAVLAFGLATSAGAQENLDQGKTAAQLFASDCAICHKSVNGLSKNAGLFGLTNFLREHYTASRESAAAISAYIEAVDKGAAPAAKKPRRTTSKSSGKKPATAKTNDDKPSEAKSDAKSDAKSESKPEAKVETKPEPKAEAKDDAKADAKPAAKPSDAKASESAKPDKSN
jgi:hypothetical protein